jgi:hypothetical protein
MAAEAEDVLAVAAEAADVAAHAAAETAAAGTNSKDQIKEVAEGCGVSFPQLFLFLHSSHWR